MSIFEYDQEKHMRMEREQRFEEGRIAGEEGLLFSLIQKKLAKGKRIPEIAEELETDEDTIRNVIEKKQKKNTEFLG